ncbi:MAG TPA: ABC transporter ATP-binding protein, partial [Chitinophagaceae bacterium]|nr:ABC transporter ATP-binding protein [Chitinophagaceae bacterium]
MPPLLSIEQLSIDFQTESGLVPGVKAIDLRVDRGEIVALVGESGSGKSITSLSILQLLPAPPARYTSGKILFSIDGQDQIDLLRQSPEQMRGLRGNRIAMIFQEPMTSLNPVFTCGHQVMEAIRLHQHINAPEARQKTLELFEKVKLPNPALIFGRYPHQLSGGQKQRVMIAMAMSCHPALLICDEPTTALDVTVQQTILQLIRELQQTEQMGVIFITHDLGVVAEIADRVAVMYKGAIVEEGPVRQIMQQPQHPYTKGLLACRPALHPKGERLPVVSDFLENGNLKSDISSWKAAADAVPGRSQQAPGSIPQTTNFLKVENLRVWYPSRKSFFGKALEYTKAVDDVTFDVYQGETLGLVGESGCGKTTLGRALLRLVEPSHGKVLLNGRDLLQYTPAELRQQRKNLQIIFQDPYSSLNPRMTIGNAIDEVLHVHHMQPTARQRREKVTDLLEKVSLKPEHYHRYPHEFSGGQRQRIVIARALALNPSFLVCDESVSALDVSVQAQVLNLLNDLKKEFGFTVIFISHDLSVIHYISDRIMVMQKGKIVETGEAGQVYHHPKEAYTQRLIAS